jgi:N-acetylmuramoyl-L-alanine amidase
VIRGAQSRDRSLPDLGVKKGPFYVLFMSSMSSLLVETGFVTNRDDAALLRSAPYRRVLADRIAEGIDRYRKQVELGLASHELRPRGTR